MANKYSVVIDSGSSGSRVYVYKWETEVGDLEEAKHSPPKIVLEKDWTKKISPGISTFADKPNNIWKQHYKDLIKFAESIIPLTDFKNTPIYVFSTAGMRLLPERKRDKLLKETCSMIRKRTQFQIGECKDHVQIIDGATEGIYGWLALNYLMGQFNNYNAEMQIDEHPSIGFMDMGGASTQIAFVPSSKDEIDKHSEDLLTVILRNVNGETQTWRVFVETWLGFGANQAKERYLKNLISLAMSSSPKSKKIVQDPCLPKGAILKNIEVGGKKYDVQGIGSYDQCLKEQYPLLMKHLVCKDEPCLFNGVHAPKMDFTRDRFVGISEYWYTANDVFNSGGEYVFQTFTEKVRTFCESDWSVIQQNGKNGEYSGLSEKFLTDACFKASWVINVLHEGFDLPRSQLESSSDGSSNEAEEAKNAHTPFKSANSIENAELSWTLGKALLIATSEVHTDSSLKVGITPSKISQNLEIGYDSDDEHDHGFSFVGLMLFFVVVYVIWRGFRGGMGKTFYKYGSGKPIRVAKTALNTLRAKLPPALGAPVSRVVAYMELQDQEIVNSELEEGTLANLPSCNSVNAAKLADLSVLRTRSAVNLNDVDDGPRPVEFLSEPFIYPKKSNGLYSHNLDSRDSLHKVSSTGSMTKGRR